MELNTQKEVLTNESANDSSPLRGRCSQKDDALIVELVKNNKECFACIIDRYENKLKRYIRRISGLPEEAIEDLTQEIFLKVYAHLNEFDQRQKFSSWIYRIAHNETINYWLYSKRRKTESWDATDTFKNTLKDSSDVEDEVYQKITNEKLVAAMGNLKDKYRQVMILNYFEGKNYQEIADELDKPSATIGTLLNRGRKLLKRELLSIGFTPESAISF